MKNAYELINNIQNDTYRYLRKWIVWVFVLFFSWLLGFLLYPFFYGNTTESSRVDCPRSNDTLVIIVSKQPKTGANGK